MLVIGNKKFRNLPEQVGFNTEQIEEIKKQLDGMVVEDHLVVLNAISGTLTDEELDLIDAPLAFISYNEKLFIKTTETGSEIIFKSCELVADEVGSAYYVLGQSSVIITISTKAYAISTNQIINIYSKTQLDSIVANIMAIKLNISDLLDKTYPVGSIYASADNTSPAAALGGTWTALGAHYLPKGDVPVIPKNDVIDLSFNSNSMKMVRAGTNVSDDNYLMGLSDGYLVTVNNTAGQPRYGIAPNNLWTNNTNNSYGSIIYLWQRVA